MKLTKEFHVKVDVYFVADLGVADAGCGLRGSLDDREMLFVKNMIFLNISLNYH